MKKTALIHYMPLEFYPPVTNLLDIFSVYKNNRVRVFSTENNKGRKIYSNSRLERIYRSSFPAQNESSFKRMVKYFMFNLACFFKLVRFQPNSILYYESYSAWPVYWYLRLFGNKTKLFIHYHEYTSPTQYLSGMRLVKLYHGYEKKFLYKKARWISHTNQQRMDLFLNDIPEVDPIKMMVLPNFPPGSWLKEQHAQTAKKEMVVRTVYIGSLSLSDTFIKEYCEWVLAQRGMVTFNIYSYNLHSDTHAYLEALDSEHICFYSDGVEYNNIPEILSNCDVGVILYKGLTENYVYNAPNKLFEYMACGLEVWFSEKMKGCYPYINDDGQTILSVDFSNLKINLKTPRSKGSSFPTNSDYIAENALKPLIKRLITEDITC